MKKSLKIILIIVLLIILFIFSLFIFYIISKEEKIDKNEEIEYQVRYMSSKLIECIDIASSSNILSSENLSDKINELYEYWNNLVLSLSLDDKIEKSDINDLGQSLNALTISLNNLEPLVVQENFILSYEKLLNIYKKIEYDKKYKEMMEIRYNMMKTYILINKNNWIEGENYVRKASDTITQIFRDSKENSYNINLVYISIKELENVLGMRNYDIFKIKYDIVIKNLNKII